MTSVTLRCTRNDGGDAAAWFASDDGSVDFTKFSELSLIDSMDCSANDELIESSGLGGGGVGDLRGGSGEDGRRSPGFGDTGRTNGSGFDAAALIEEEEEDEDATTGAGEVAGVAGAGGAGIFIGGGGIIPLLRSTRVTTGREIDISGPSLIGAGALRLTTFDTPGFCLSKETKNKQNFNCRSN